jgi:hypothetical protein
VTRAERRRVAEFGHELGLASPHDALDYAAGEREPGNSHTDLREGRRCFRRSRSALHARERERIGAR